MQLIAAGFDRLAPFYNTVSGIVFGKTLQQSQEYFLNILKPDDRVLVLGGGSGDFLHTLLMQQPDIPVDYIDISPKMIELARKKTFNPANVNFIVGTEQDIPNTSYSVVITNFYLDLFSNKKLKSIIEKIKGHLHPHARWLATDFVSEKWWHKIMLWVMYRFFNVTTGIEANRLPEWQTHLTNFKIIEIESTRLYSNFIKSVMFRVE